MVAHVVLGRGQGEFSVEDSATGVDPRTRHTPRLGALFAEDPPDGAGTVERQNRSVNASNHQFYWLGNASRILDAAHWGSWADCLEMIQKRHPDVARSVVQRLATCALLSASRRGKCCRKVAEGGCQHPELGGVVSRFEATCETTGTTQRARPDRTTTWLAARGVQQGPQSSTRRSCMATPERRGQSVCEVAKWTPRLSAFHITPSVQGHAGRFSAVPGTPLEASTFAVTPLCPFMLLAVVLAFLATT